MESEIKSTGGKGPQIVPQSPEVRAMVNTWQPLLDAAGIKTGQLLRRLDFGASTLSRILSDKYAAEFPADRARKIDGVIRSMVDEAGQQVLGRGGKFLEFAEHTLLARVLQSARANAAAADEHKLCFFVAPPGFGKDATQDWLSEKDPNVRKVEARPSWASSYLAVLHSLCEAVDVPTTEEVRDKAGKLVRTRTILYNVRLAETALFAALRERTFTICLNEVSQMSGALMKLIKALVNETSSVVVVFCTPEYYRILMGQARRLGEEEHLARRSTAITARTISGAQVLKFAELMGLDRTLQLPDADLTQAGTGTAWQENGRTLAAAQWASVLAEEAQAFAGFDLVRQCLDALRKAGASATMRTLREAVAVAKRPKVLAVRRVSKGKGAA